MYLNYRELDAQIIIIGAGLSALSAAYHLLEKDPHIDILILDVEGESHFCVRNEYSSLRSSSTSLKKIDEFIDYQFIHPQQINLVNFLEKLNIKIIRNQSSNGKILVDYDKLFEIPFNGDIFSMLTFDERMILNTFSNQIMYSPVSFRDCDVFPEFDNISMEILLMQLISSKKVRDFISQIFLFNAGLQPKDVSASFFFAYCNSTQCFQTQFTRNEEGIYQFFIENGAEYLRYKLLKIINEQLIRKVAKISEISWDNYCAGIKTPDEYFFTNKIIFTLNEVETNKINFIPPLPDEKRVIASNLVRGTCKKFIVKYSKPFWTEKDLSGEVYVMNTIRKNGPIHFCLNVTDVTNDNYYTLAGLAEEKANKLEILKQLCAYFGTDALKPVHYKEISSSFHELSFMYGCKSLNNFSRIQKNTDRIIWAGPETAKSWYGTTAGSIEAGFKGALRVLQETKPNALTLEDINIICSDELCVPIKYEGIKWHIVIPTFLLAIYAFMKINRYFSKNWSDKS